MMKTIKNKAVATGLLLLPMVASATSHVTTPNFFTKLGGWIDQLIALLLGIATVVFLIGVIQYVISGADEKKAETAKKYMLWGIIGLVVMVAVWGIANLLVDTLGLTDTTVKDVAKFDFSGN